jgi:coproporphyrinogen III oxidase
VSDIDLNRVKHYLMSLQDTLCERVSQLNNGLPFQTDEWQNHSGGGGRTRVVDDLDEDRALTSGHNIIEKGGVNFSHVYGDSLPAAASAKRPEIAGKPFQAMGVSSVIHPTNPFAPTAHMNVRFFVADYDSSNPVWWFGGGYDLTPYYPVDADILHWHKTAKAACDQFDSEYYAKYKAWCDEYFYLKHRKETRGVGGLFFDDFTEGGFEQAFGFMQNVGNSFGDAYLPIVERNKDRAFTDEQKAFQSYRRGRYVEFNLIYDRGTIFGLQAGGRIESILMSLPANVSWKYAWQATPGTAEKQLTDYYLKPQDWLGLLAK